jgi:hypothetical protein
MSPFPPRAAAALLAALAFAGPAAAQFDGHTVTVQPLTLRLQTGPATFSPSQFFMGLAINGTVPAPPSPYTTATVTRPDLTTVNLGQYATNHFISEFLFPTLDDLRTAYPGGTYAAAVGPGGPELPTVGLPADYTLPTFPEFTNYNAIQGLNPQQDFTFQFTAFGGSAFTRSTALGFTDIDTGEIAFTDVVDPNATSYTLPAGTLTAGRSYAVSLYFIELVDFNLAIDGEFIHLAQANVASANVVAVTPVPEPAAALAAAAAGLIAAARRLRRGQVRCAEPGGAVTAGPGV